MKTIGIIPARYASTRFPGKPLALINNKPMIQWVYEAVSSISSIDSIYIATDDERIKEKVESFGGKVLMTSDKHETGSDRIAECANLLKLADEDIIINIQGDEPLIKKEMIEDLISAFNDDEVYMATLKKKINNEEEITNSNVVKVITNNQNNAIYFSRYPIPFNRNNNTNITYYKHIGIYGYKKWFLIKFNSMPKSYLENMESLEQLRIIENGYSIKTLETNWQSIGVDTKEQILQVEEIMKKEM